MVVMMMKKQHFSYILMQVVEKEEKYDNFWEVEIEQFASGKRKKNVQKEDRVIVLSYLVFTFLP